MPALVADSVESFRLRAVQALRQGLSPVEVAALLDKSVSWVYKCQALYRGGGREALVAKSTRPHHSSRALAPAVYAAIHAVRVELEAEAARPHALCYIGAQAVRNRLHRQGVTPLPSISTVERTLRRAGLTHLRQCAPVPEVSYPHLAPRHVHELVQVDIFPRYLPGGTLVSCFHAVDVVSHYPTGCQHTSKRAVDAADFLLQVWRELGVPLYTQLDNEGCFSGGFTHAHVLGQVVRLGLWAGTQLVFSPYYHPESNGTVERFHQEYARNTWRRQHFETLTAVQQASQLFFDAYRQSAHQRALAGETPAARHDQLPRMALPALAPAHPLPLYSGRIHFLRKVSAERTVQVLNVHWAVPDASPETGVWVTLDLTVKGAALAVFDTAPDALKRRCLATHPFPLKTAVLAHPRPPYPAANSPAQPRPRHMLVLTPLYDVLKTLPVVKALFDSTIS